jgi:hypothetical protein
MDRTTVEAVGVPLRPLTAALKQSASSRPPFQRAQRHRRIVTAAGIDVDHLSEHGRRVPGWLADCDEPTIESAVELVTTTRARAAGSGSGDRA